MNIINAQRVIFINFVAFIMFAKINFFSSPKVVVLLMMCKTTILVLNAQNLILNPSFEDIITLPVNLSSSIENYAYHWSTPNNHSGTSDLYHVNNTQFVSLGIPSNISGYQDTCNGLAYAGIFVFNEYLSGLFGHEFREYITGAFSMPLEQDTCYKISFKYSLAEDYSTYAISNLGIHFSQTKLTHTNANFPANKLDEVPQIVFNQYFDDFDNWVEVSAFFVAEGGENYFTLGNFNLNANTDTLRVIDGTVSGNNSKASYIYIDDFKLEKSKTIISPSVNFTGDTALCKGQKLTLYYTSNDSSVFYWNGVNPSDTIEADTTGKYWLSYIDNLGCFSSFDDVFLNIIDIDNNLGNDTLICKREQIELISNVNKPEATFLWNTGDTTPFIIVSDTGVYKVVSSLFNCKDEDSIFVGYHIPESAKLKNKNIDTLFCKLGLLTADTSVWKNSYLWSTGATSNSIEVEESGYYTLLTENECDESLSEFYVHKEFPQIFFD